MVLKEQKRSETLTDLDSEISFITNLNNIKQGLKQDYSDKQILDIIFVNSEFTDSLIKDHLRTTVKDQKGDTIFVERDPSKYREFIKQTYNSKD